MSDRERDLVCWVIAYQVLFALIEEGKVALPFTGEKLAACCRQFLLKEGLISN